MDDVAILLEIHEAFDRDAQSGRPPDLGEYLLRFPGFEDLVRREFERLKMRSVPGSPGADAAGHADGRHIVGGFRLERELGRGGQGIVYLGRHVDTGALAAVKLLTGVGSDVEEVLARFRREAALCAQVRHPGICTVLGSGTSELGPYLAMQYVEGETLADQLRAERARYGLAPGGPVREDAVLDGPATPAGHATLANVIAKARLMEKVARTLHAAHQAGVVHRDVKPGNILVRRDGEPVLLDFGVARSEAAVTATLTRTGDFLGTPGYASPEQLTAQRILPDLRTDIWSVGVTLYEILTLVHPFRSPNGSALFQAILAKVPPRPSSLNPAIDSGLESVIEVALQKDRDGRYRTAEELADDLSAAVEGRPVMARRLLPGRARRTWGWMRRRSAVLAATIAIVAAAAFGLTYEGRRRTPPEVSEEEFASCLTRGIAAFMVPPRTKVRFIFESRTGREVDLVLTRRITAAEPDPDRDRFNTYNNYDNDLRPEDKKRRGFRGLLPADVQNQILTQERLWENASEDVAVVWLFGRFKDPPNVASAGFRPCRVSPILSGGVRRFRFFPVDAGSGPGRGAGFVDALIEYRY